MKRTAARTRRDAAGARPELAALFEEAVRFYFQLTRTATVIHRHGERSGARRTVLLTLARTGPLTVAHIARARSEPRQRLQPLVNALVREGVLAYVANPAHKKSPLVALTPKGDATVRRIVEIESGLRARLDIDVPPAALDAARAVLRRVREVLERPDTIQMLDASSRLPKR